VNIKARLTENEAMAYVKQNGHTMRELKQTGPLRVQQCTVDGCHSSLFVDDTYNLVYGSAITHPCKDYRATNTVKSISTKTPYTYAKKTKKHDYSYMKDTEWKYDNGMTKKTCTVCKQPLYRIFKFKDGKRYTGLFCEKCKAIYNVRLNTFCYTTLTFSERCDSIGE
jgi:hypothetical protein